MERMDPETTTLADLMRALHREPSKTLCRSVSISAASSTTGKPEEVLIVAARGDGMQSLRDFLESLYRKGS